MDTVIDKEGYTSHVATLNGTRNINYRYCSKRFGGSGATAHDHFEFLNLLISETGYLSHFVNAAAVESYGGHHAYAKLFCNEFIGDKVNTAQVDLFDCCF
jgi:hypothetical protein